MVVAVADSEPASEPAALRAAERLERLPRRRETEARAASREEARSASRAQAARSSTAAA